MTSRHYMLGWTVWRKPDAFSPIIDGILAHVKPEDAAIWFAIDGPDEESSDAFRDQSKRLADYRVMSWVSDHELREVGCHNAMLARLVAAKGDLIGIYQDDQYLTGPIIPDLDRLLDHYGAQLGVCGGRDGFDPKEGNRASSEWSEVKGGIVLKAGEWAERPCLNSGPIFYPRLSVEQIGLLDEEFVAFNVWADYGMRAIQLGLKVAVMGTSLRHCKTGPRYTATTWYTKEIYDNDFGRIRKKWPQWR